MDLIETPNNPIPSHPVVATITTNDGIALRTARWRQTTRKCKGTVLLIQGRAEFIEKYFETITELRRRGFCVATFDWRGQGGSQRLLRAPRKGHVRRFSDFENDLESFMIEVVAPHCPKPWYGLAHSMGGAIVIEALHKKKLAIERLVTVAPMIAIDRVHNPFAALCLASFLSMFGFSRGYIPGGGATSISTKPFKGNRLTSDPARYTRNAEVLSVAPDLAIGDPTVGWARSAFLLMRRFQRLRYPREILTPMLVIMAGADRMVSTPAIEAFAAQLKAGSGIIIPHAKHEILMETDEIRSLFWAAFDAFIPGSHVSWEMAAEDEPGLEVVPAQAMSQLSP